MKLTQSELLKVILNRYDYNPQTGIFIFKNTPRCHRYLSNKIAGCLDREGYIRLRINNHIYYAHRIAYLYFHKEIIDDKRIDHINGIKNDNCISNLRIAYGSENQENVKRAGRNNKLGVMGVSKTNENTYRAQILINGKPTHLGCFKTIKEASQVYQRAKIKHHKGYVP